MKDDTLNELKKYLDGEKSLDENYFNEYIESFVEKGFKRFHLTIKSIDKTTSVRLIFDFISDNKFNLLVEREDKKFQIEIELYDDINESARELKRKLELLDIVSFRIIEETLKTGMNSISEQEIERNQQIATDKYNALRDELFPPYSTGSGIRYYPKGKEDSSYWSCVGQYTVAGSLLGALATFGTPVMGLGVKYGGTIGMMIGFTQCRVRYHIR
jgi:hypothetical protein